MVRENKRARQKNKQARLIWLRQDIEDLQYALLVQAMIELKDKRRSLSMKQEAWQWLFTDSASPFSSYICALSHNLDIDALRMGLKSYVSAPEFALIP